MPERGLEPPPSYLDKNLNLARLPIPPLGRVRPPRGRQVGKSYQRVTGPQGGRGDAGHGVTGYRDGHPHSTVTLLARFRGLSTSQPRSTAM